ncbi:MAG: magnesium chelatase ATPase subunit D [Chloroflexota bacterium]|jgi:magnesium chelatase subunit D
MTTHALPMAGLVGMQAAHEALQLLAVDPRLGGVAIGAAVGSGKSSVARASMALFGPQAPFVELPLGSDEEALLGGIDIEATLRTGRRTIRHGLLQRANGGVLYVDALNLIADSVANILLGVLDSGVIRLEREGISQHIASSFRLIGTYDPQEGLPRRHLLDRMGLLVLMPPQASVEDRQQVLRHHLSPDIAHWQELDVLQAELVAEARALLPSVTMTPAQQQQLVSLALRAGVEGQRADLFAVATACAAAALDLRTTVNHDDLELAARLVIMPRATRDVADEQPMPPPPPPPPAPAEASADEQNDGESTPPEAEAELQVPDEEVLEALTCEVPIQLADLPFRTIRRGRSGSRGAVSGTRGRHIRSAPGNPRRARIDIPATLRSAAPWQPLRQTTTMRHLSLRVDDIRVKQYRSKAGVLFCFVVDASGSMALNRMRQAKGAVQHLLQQAYVHRDRVALLAFRGTNCDLLLPPSQSVELARRALDVLPTGGTTPLAAALLATIDVAAQARSRGIMQCVALFLTDGRGNVSLQRSHDVAEEVQVLANSVVAAGIKSVVIDTQRNYLSRGEGRKLAELLQGEYVYLPQATGADIAATAVALA